MIRSSKALLIMAALVSLASPAWAHQPHDPYLVVAMSPNFQNDQTLLVASDYLTVSIGVYLPLISTDGGNTLTPLRGIPNLPTNAIQFSPSYSTDGTILMGGEGGIFLSTDKGLVWTPVTVGNGATINGISFSSNFLQDGTVYVATQAGVFESVNRAVSFSPVTSPGPLTGTLSTITLSPNFAADQTIVVGSSQNGIFLSTNAGSTWTNETQSQTLSAVQTLAFSPTFKVDKTIFAATYGTGVFLSTNNGVTWTTSNTGITDQDVSSLIVYPGYVGSGALMISTAGAGVFTSNNRGQSWTKAANVYRHLSPQTDDHYRYLAAAQNGSAGVTVILGMFEGLWISTNRAQSWTYIDTLPTYLLRKLRVSSTYTTDHTVLGTSYGGGQLYSGDGGTNWALKNTGAQNSYPDADAISPNYANDQTFLVGDLTGLEITTNAGANWKTALGLGAAAYVRGLGVSPNFANDKTVLVGTDNRDTRNPPTVTYNGQTYSNQGLFLSTDGGNTWIPTSLNGPCVDGIVPSPGFATDKTAYAVSATSGLFETTDGGLTWSQALNLATDPGMLDVIVSPNYDNDHVAFAATPHSGIYKTTNGGASWSQLPNSTPYTAISFAISPNYAADQTLFVGTFQSGLIESKDGGDTYKTTGLTQNFVTGLAISNGFATDKTIFAASYRGVYKSTNGGNNWSFTDQPNRQEDDRMVNILYSGDWTSVNSEAASTASYKDTSQTAATAQVFFFGTGFSWIALTGPKGGSAAVSVDGVAVGTASFQSSQTMFQQTVFAQSGLTCSLHTVEFTSSSTASMAAINLDAVDSNRNGCGY